MTFSYAGIDRSGKKVKGQLQADSVREAIDKLRSMGVMVTDIRAKDGAKPSVASGVERKRVIFRPRLKDVVLFARQLETMISAGIRLADAVTTLSEQEVFSRRFRQALREVATDMKGGLSFSEALDRQGIFENVFINMVRAGEEGGVLDVTMRKVANYYESVNRLQEQVRSSMAYPMFILGFAVFVVIVISLFILPNLIRAFGTVPTSGMIGFLVTLNRLLTERWQIVAIVVGVTFVGLRLFFRTVYGNYVKDSIANLIPPVRKLRMKMANERFSRTLGVLVGSGVALTNALEMAAKASNNIRFIETVGKISEQVKAGSSLKEALKRAGIFPQIIYEMVGTGEETGRLDTVMEKVADFYEEEIVNDTKKLVSLVEPMLIAFVGMFIAFIAYAMYSTIFQMQQQIGR